MRPGKIVAVILLIIAALLPASSASAEPAPLCADQPIDFVGRFEGTAAYGAEGRPPLIKPLEIDIALLVGGELLVTVTGYFEPEPDLLHVEESKFRYRGWLWNGWDYWSFFADSADVACDGSGALAQFSGDIWGIQGDLWPIPGTYAVSRV